MKNESEENSSFYKTSRYDVILAVAIIALSVFYTFAATKPHPSGCG